MAMRRALLTGFNEFDPIVFTVDTTISGNTPSDTFGMPINKLGDSGANFSIDWGDGSTENFVAYDNSVNLSHTYAVGGVYTIRWLPLTIDRRLPWNCSNCGYPLDAKKILDISDFGSVRMYNSSVSANFRGQFKGCSNLVITATNTKQAVVDGSVFLYETFFGCANITTIPGIETWDVSGILGFPGMFIGCSKFNDNVSSWDISSSTSNMNMFLNCRLFNQDLSGWVSNGNSSGMFSGCFVLDTDVPNLVTSNVTGMREMFLDCRSFNGDVSNWDTGGCTDMYSLFEGCYIFNQAVNHFDVSKVTTARQMFYKAYAFNQSLANWDFSSCIEFIHFLRNCNAFNSSVANIKLKNTARLFFYQAPAFNHASINTMDTSLTTNFERFLDGASSFDQDISGLDFSKATVMTNFLTSTSFSTANYDLLLISLSGQALQSGVTIDIGTTKYTAGGAAATARANIISNYGWTINDGGPV